MTFQRHPLNDDLIALKNEQAIARSVRNIVFTTPGEKFFDQDFGSKISASLFENLDDISANIIAAEIRSIYYSIYEPRVELISVRLNPDYDSNAFNATIVYRIIGADVPPQELQFVLQQTR